MKKVLVIAGPTASGKTAFSLRMAKVLQGRIISGDSIQVYRGLDIGSGKIRPDQMEGVEHQLLDIKDPQEPYSAADFQKEARSWIERDDRFPIICGGTGLYLKSCLYDYSFSEEVEESPVDAEFESLDTETLYKKLCEVDPEVTYKIHANNRRRIQRSLTIWKRTGRKQSEMEAEQSHEPIYDTWIAGCTMDRDRLYARINARVEQMFQDGLEEEVRNLVKQGVRFEDPGMRGIGYQEFKPYLQGECDLQTVKEEIQKHSRQYAKRQYTWLNHQMPVHWFESLEESDCLRMEEEIRTWAISKNEPDF